MEKTHNNMQYNKEKRREYYLKNKDKIKVVTKEYRIKNKDRLNVKRNIRNKLLSPEKKAKAQATAKKYREANKEKVRLTKNLWTIKNWKTIYEKRKKRRAEKMKEDPDFYKRKIREIWKRSTKIKESNKKWKEENKEKLKESLLKNKLKYPEKHEARLRFNSIRYSKSRNIIPLPCEVCGEEKTEAHHDDYNKPFDVRWLCKTHHMEFHRLHVYDTKSYTYVKFDTTQI